MLNELTLLLELYLLFLPAAITATKLDKIILSYQIILHILDRIIF